MKDVVDTLRALEAQLSVMDGGVAIDGVFVPEVSVRDALVHHLYSRYFCRRRRQAPVRPRASGDSGFVAHLSSAARGTCFWETHFRVVRRSQHWAFVSNGRICLFIDELEQMTPASAAVGDAVSVWAPRVRENVSPHRFTLYGGGGAAFVRDDFVKYFIAVRSEAAAALVATLCGPNSANTAYTFSVVNDPRDFERCDVACVDVAPAAEEHVARTLKAFVRREPDSVQPKIPLFSAPVDIGIGRTFAQGAEDAGAGFGWRRCSWLADRIHLCVTRGEMGADDWLAALRGTPFFPNPRP